MTAVTICSDFGAQENKVCHSFHCFCIYLPWGDGHDLSFWMLSFKPAFSPLLFHLHQEALQFLFIFCDKGGASAYLRLLIFLPCSLAFCMMYSVYKLNKQGDNTQPWRIPFPIWNQSVVPCPVLTVASWPECKFLKRQVRWSGIPISFRIFHSLLWSTQSK